MNNKIALGIIGLQIEDAHDAMNAAQRAADNAPMYKMPEMKAALLAAQSVHKALCDAYDAIEKESEGESEEEKKIRELERENKRLASQSKNWEDNYQQARKNNTLLAERAWDAGQSAKAGEDRLEEMAAEIVNLKALLMLTENNLRDSKIQAEHDAEQAEDQYRSKRAECNELSAAKERLYTVISDLNDEVAELQGDNDAVRAQNDEYRAENKELYNRVLELESQVIDREFKIQSLQATVDDMTVNPVGIHPDQLELL